MFLQIALAGNPNSGKTTLFNELTGSNAFVGNWPGVTIEKKEGSIIGHEEMTLVDLPGVYSLDPYTLEEKVTRQYLEESPPDVIINIVDASKLERSLFLTTQLLETGIPTVIAMNMLDLVEKYGDRIDSQLLSDRLGAPIVSISARYGSHTEELISLVKKTAEGGEKPAFEPVHYPEDLGDDPAVEKTCIRYQRVDQLIEGAYQPQPQHEEADALTDRIDRIVTSPRWGIPLFIALLFLLYFVAIVGGKRGGEWIEEVLIGDWISGGLSRLLETAGASPWIESLLLDGIVAGIGSILSFIPQMALLYFFLAILEQSGYMSRIAFILDRLFRRFGLAGKSFIPLLLGSGCSVPGIMASRTIDNDSDRRLTIITTSFIPCMAKLPIISFMAAAFFDGSWWFGPLFYLIGLASVILSGLILKKTRYFGGDPAPFFMELPSYQLPKLSTVLRSVGQQIKAFLKKASTVILLSTVIIWLLFSFGITDQGVGLVGDDISHSFLANLGQLFSWLFIPLGFGNWQSVASSLSGLIAKENLVSSFGIIYGLSGDSLQLVQAGDPIALGRVGTLFTPLTAFSFLLFNLLNIPCMAAVNAMRQELGSRKWTFLGVLYQFLFAYAISLMVTQLGLLFQTHHFTIFTALACFLLAGFLYLLFRPDPYKEEE